MQGAFGTVLWVVAGVGIVAAIITLAGSGKTWTEFGKNRLLMDHDTGRPTPPGSAAALLERDLEIRQMLEARNARRLRRGEATLDVDAEPSRLTAPHIHAELRSKIR